jgi:hypothetical protein
MFIPDLLFRIRIFTSPNLDSEHLGLGRFISNIRKLIFLTQKF